ncbi:MAG TPA: MFS transporter [Desulfomonilia bacterium]|nr:MFS transporter [Desulfomonilia bacterium]
MRKMFYGWWIVLATFIVLFVGLCSGFYTVSVFMEPIQKAFGWNRTQISLSFTIAALLVGLLSPVVGLAVARFGVKKVQLFGALVVGSGMTLGSFVQALWQFYGVYAFVAVGLASVSLVPSQTIISHWFEKRRGTAMGLIMTGTGLGGMVMVYIAGAVNDAYGVRWAYRVLGVMVLIIVVPTIVFIIRDRPEDLGLVPDGTADPEPETPNSLKISKGLTVKEALRTLPFNLTCAMMTLFCIILGGLTMHAIALFRSYGIDRAGTLWSLTLGMSVLGRILFGFLSDKIAKKNLIAVSWIMHILGFGSIMLISSLSLFVWGFVVFYGLALGAFVTLLPVFIGERFGVLHFSKLIGIVSSFQILGLAVGSVLLGKIFDMTASYENAVTLLLMISILALIITALIGRPKMEASTSPAAL